MPNQLAQIEHVVHLILENQSFDQMLGFLYEHTGNVSSKTGQKFDGLTGNEFNPDENGVPVKVYKIDPQVHTYLMPGADPGEGYQNTNYQLFCTDKPNANDPPSMMGFVVNFNSAIATVLSKHA